MKSYYSLPTAENKYSFEDRIGVMADRVINQWLLQVVGANPGILRMLEERNKVPYRDLLPWSGEFIGKHLTSCTEVYMLTGDKALKNHIKELVREIAETQDKDGYIGPWAVQFQLTGYAPNSRYSMNGEEEVIPVWDTWDFYHIMYGLMCWYQAEKDEAAIKISRRLADLLEKRFFEKGVPLSSIGTPETNLAPVHSLALLYEVTGENRYLSMAEKIVEEFELSDGGNYMKLALAGKDYWEMPIPRWEGLHPIMGLAVLYDITGKQEYRNGFRKLWWSMVRTDRHNTGGFTSGEAACGNPYDGRAIETCCTVAWMALTVEMLKMEMSSIYADELELSLYNGGLGAISPTGRWCTYNTPMEGYRMPSFKEIDFQIRPGTPELNCCSVNAPRILGLLSQWACMEKDGEIYINYYGNYETEMVVQGKKIKISQKSNYPVEGKIHILLETEKDSGVNINLRIPNWSAETIIKYGNGSKKAQSGTYFHMKQAGLDVKEIELQIDMNLHFWKGEKEQIDRTSVYYGPILLACDETFSQGENEIHLDAERMKVIEIREDGKDVWMFIDIEDINGKKITFCDFRSAGYQGSSYKTWFCIENVHKVSFSENNPMRIFRI